MCRNIVASVLLLLVTASVAAAPCESPIDPRVVSQVQAATRSFIDEHLVDGVYLYYDSATDTLKRLEFKMLHPLISRDGDLYIARADFFDDEGRPVNMSFLVVTHDNRPRTLQAVAHMLGPKVVTPCAKPS